MHEFQSWMQKHFPLDLYLLITFFSLGKIHHLQSPEFVKLVIVFYLQMVQCLGGLKKKKARLSFDVRIGYALLNRNLG